MTDVPGLRPPPRAPGGAGDVARPAERARLRLVLALVGTVLLALVLGPVALLVHDSWTPLVDLDLRVSRAAEGLDGSAPGLLSAARVLTRLGDPVGITVASVVGVLLLLAAGRRRAALFVLVARVGSLVLSQGTKTVVDRARPVFDEPVATAFGASFPSGHALGGTVFWLTTALVLLPRVRPGLRRPLLAVAAVVPLVVGATRVLLGVHYLSDVVAGTVLGVAWTAVCASVFALWRAEEGRPADVLEQGVDA